VITSGLSLPRSGPDRNRLASGDPDVDGPGFPADRVAAAGTTLAPRPSNHEGKGIGAAHGARGGAEAIGVNLGVDRKFPADRGGV